jgi:elongation factor 4
MQNIRNFCIIAHIDHGKSTLADRLLEITNTIEKREMRAQHLDTMELEQERGITIKLQPVRMEYELTANKKIQNNQKSTNYQLNLIDTPGHADFAYEVSRSLSAVEGALLVIDATQGIEAQTLATIYAAIEADLKIIPILNKIDLPAANPDRIKQEIENVLSIPATEVIEISAKTGENCEKILPAIIERIPPPAEFENTAETKALIFDSIFDIYRGVVIFVRNFSGEIKKNDKLKLLRANLEFEALEVGFFKPKFIKTNKIDTGEIGYIVTGLKSVREARVGETVWKMESGGRKVEDVLNSKNQKPEVLLISGICGSGKTTMAKIIEKKLGFVRISGDDFCRIPKIWSAENAEKLKEIHQKIIFQAKDYLKKGKNVVIDYVLDKKEEIEMYRQNFNQNLEIKILNPCEEIALQRDKNRECWTVEKGRISQLAKIFENLKSELGKESFIDNSAETPEQTFEKHFQKPKTNNQKPTPLSGFKKVSPFVFAGIFAIDADDFPRLRESLEKLSLNDASLTFEPERSTALGFGFRVGFLGLLHLEIVQERLEREYDLNLIVTAPSVKYQILDNSNQLQELANPSELPEIFQEIREPWVSVEIVTPKNFLGKVLELLNKRRGIQKNLSFLDLTRALITYELPLASIVTEFYDCLKNVSSGYASLSYEHLDFRVGDLARLDFLVADEKIDALSLIVARQDARRMGMKICKKLKKIIPRANFVIPIQAAIGAQIIARETLSAFRKDVIAKLYGGDRTRKDKLLKKQKAGKKRLKQFGKVSLPQEAFLAILGNYE